MLEKENCSIQLVHILKHKAQHECDIKYRISLAVMHESEITRPEVIDECDVDVRVPRRPITVFIESQKL